MGETDGDRIKASRLRRAQRRTPQQQRWLDEYTTRVLSSKKTRTLPPDRMATPVNTNAAHSTSPVEGNADEFTWSPSVPVAAADEALPPPGVDSAVPGTPIVDIGPPPGDLAAARQAAFIVALIVRAGIAAAIELGITASMPPPVRAMAEDPVQQALGVDEIAQAAYRLALKYNLRSIPMSDEIVVGGAVSASALAWLTLQKRRNAARKTAAEQNAPMQAKDANPPESEEQTYTVDETPNAPPPVKGIWS